MDEYIEEILGDDFPEWSNDGIGWDVLVAPDGCRVEQDGQCPHGHVSPLRQLGLI